jgi:vancomycin resistance protein VanW
MTFCSLFFLLLFLPTAVAADSGTSYSHLWGGFSTSLVTRSPEQRGNAGRAALDLNGTIISPGAVFSFNEIVGARDTMKGYLPAPIINDRGGLSDTPGGGICQLATTIYNAALEADLEIVERHPHSRSVGYVPPGRDATILTWRKDLKLRNPHSFPLLLRVAASENRLTAGFWSVVDKSFQVTISTDIIAVDPEAVVSRFAGQSGAIHQSGGRGFSVVTRRRVIRDGVAAEEVLSRDFYPPPSRIMGNAEP